MPDEKNRKVTAVINSMDDIGAKIKGFGTIISVIGAIVLSVGVVVKYFIKKES